MLSQLVAKGLLTGYRDAFGSMDTVATARFVTRQVVGFVAERTQARALASRLLAAARGRTGEGDLRDRAVQLGLFVDREQHVLDSLARRMRRVASSPDAFAGFNDAQDHLLKAAAVHTDRVLMEAFAAAVERCADDDTRRVLALVADLHALSTIEADLGWFLTHGRLTPAQAKAVTAGVNALCAELRPLARDLVDGFGIPDEWLGATIVSGTVAAREAVTGSFQVMG